MATPPTPYGYGNAPVVNQTGNPYGYTGLPLSATPATATPRPLPEQELSNDPRIQQALANAGLKGEFHGRAHEGWNNTSTPIVQQVLRGEMGRGFQGNAYGTQNQDLAIQNLDDPNRYQDELSRRRLYETGGWDSHADSQSYYLGGNRDYAGQRMAQMDAGAAAMGAPSRYQPGIDYAGMVQMGAANQIAGVGGQFGGVANQIGGAANGAGYGGQMRSADALYAMGQQPQGMSASEMAMRSQAGQALQSNAALAAGARGANAGLGMRNAAMGNSAVQGNVISQLGQQRANEDLAYRNQRMQALGAAGQGYGNAMGSQVSALGQQANVLGGQAQTYGAAGQMAGAAGQMALQGAGLEISRDDAARQYYGLGNSTAATQLGASMGYDAQRTGNYLTEYGIEKGIQAQKDSESRAFDRQLLGAALTAGGAVVGGLAGGPGGAMAGGAAASQIGRR